MSRLVPLIILLLLCQLALADANEGEFLGFKIGQRVSVRDPSLVLRTWKPGQDEYLAKFNYVNKKSKNRDFDFVQLTVTPVSYTILEIAGTISVKSMDEANAVLNKYFKLLNQMYPDFVDDSPFKKDDCGYICDLINEDAEYELQFQFRTCVDPAGFYWHAGLKRDGEFGCPWRGEDDTGGMDVQVLLTTEGQRADKLWDLATEESIQYRANYLNKEIEDIDKSEL